MVKMKKVPNCSKNGSTVTIAFHTVKLVPFTPSAHACSSLLQTVVNCGSKKYYYFGPGLNLRMERREYILVSML